MSGAKGYNSSSILTERCSYEESIADADDHLCYRSTSTNFRPFFTHAVRFRSAGGFVAQLTLGRGNNVVESLDYFVSELREKHTEVLGELIAYHRYMVRILRREMLAMAPSYKRGTSTSVRIRSERVVDCKILVQVQ